MNVNIDLETKVIRRFIDKTKQDRYIQFILTPKNRRKFTCDLAHFNYLMRGKFTELTGNAEYKILDVLQKNNIATKSCYIISEDINIDTKVMGVIEAIRKTVGYGMGTIIVFGDASMILYEGEDLKSRYISKVVQ